MTLTTSDDRAFADDARVIMLAVDTGDGTSFALCESFADACARARVARMVFSGSVRVLADGLAVVWS